MANSNNISNMPTPANTHQNAMAQNQLNPNAVYGLQPNTGCLGGTCPANTLSSGYYIPSLQQIAEASQNIPVQRPANIYQGDLTSVPAVSELEKVDETQPPLPMDTLQTPATTTPNGAAMGPLTQSTLGITDYFNPYPVTPESIQYLNGFIRTQIGRRVSIDFLVGSNTIVTKSGYLLGVAQNYILINELDTNDITTCDFYNIKFIRFYF